MKLFQHSQGFVVAFGFDMTERKPSPRRICWSDPGTGEWEPKLMNQAGSVDLGFPVKPEFIREHAGKIIAYQPGKCLEMQYIGAPFVWSIVTLQSDMDSISEAA